MDSRLTNASGQSHRKARASLIVPRRINTEMAVDIDRIAGEAFLENIRAQHVLYGKMVAGLLQHPGTTLLRS